MLKAWIPLPALLVGDSPVNYPLTTQLTAPQNSGNWGELPHNLPLQKMVSNNVATKRYILVCKISAIKFLKFFPWLLWICNGPAGFILILTTIQLSLFTLVLLTFHFFLAKSRLLKNKFSFSAIKKDNFKLPHTPPLKSLLLSQATAYSAHTSERVLAPKWPASSLKSAQAGFKVNP